MYCQKCGIPIPDANEFCHKCGHQLNTPIPIQNPERKLPAGVLKRLLNYVLDDFFRKIIALIPIGIGIAIHSNVLIGFGIFIFLIYHIVCESIWQKTLGKLITGTKVIGFNGNKPGFWRIVGRSLSRAIPFEQLSFLFGGYPIGWHDSISKTLVVPDNITSEDVQQMNLSEIKKMKSENVLIKIIIIFLVVLFILAIIGILASVVLASMNQARAKARDAKIESNLSTIVIKAENYKNLNGSYLGLCEDSEISFLTLTNSSSTKPYTEITCNDNEQAYAVSASLSNPDDSLSGHQEYFCVDSTGVATKTTNDISIDGNTSCSTSLVETYNNKIDSTNGTIDENKYAYYNLGQNYQSMDAYENAIKEYEKAIELDIKNIKNPSNELILFREATIYQNQSEYRKLENVYNRILLINPQNTQAYSDRAFSVYGNTGEHEKALIDYTESLRLDPNNQFNLFMKANTEFKLGKINEMCSDISKIDITYLKGFEEGYNELKRNCN